MKVHEYNIGTPMWSSQINRHQILDISITHKDAYGNRTFPDKYRVTKEFAEKYPKRIFNRMKEHMYVIPINDLPLSPEEDT